MSTSIGQYSTVFLPGEPPLWQRNMAGHSLQGSRVGHYRSNPARIEAKPFLPVAVLPQWELSVKVAQLLVLWGPWWLQVCRDRDSLHCRSYGPIRFFQASCSWQSEGLFGRSFSVAPPIQGLKKVPLSGILLCCSVPQAHRWPLPGWSPTL